MATRSAIGYKAVDGTIRAVYCHWDGYLGNNGLILNQMYTDQSKIWQMVELGDISSLKGEIADTVYYGRDKGETDVATQSYNDVDEYVTHYADGCEYMYLWNNKYKEWVVTQGDGKWMRLEDALELEAIAF